MSRRQVHGLGVMVSRSRYGPTLSRRSHVGAGAPHQLGRQRLGVGRGGRKSARRVIMRRCLSCGDLGRDLVGVEAPLGDDLPARS